MKEEKKVLKNVTLVVSLATVLVLSSFVAFVYGELYKMYDDTYMKEDVYEFHVLYCSDLQRDDRLNSTLDCADYVLTEEWGYDLIISAFLDVDPKLDEFKKILNN